MTQQGKASRPSSLIVTAAGFGLALAGGRPVPGFLTQAPPAGTAVRQAPAHAADSRTVTSAGKSSDLGTATRALPTAGAAAAAACFIAGSRRSRRGLRTARRAVFGSRLRTAVTEEEVLAAQQGWGDALVSIATTFDEQGHAAAKALAEQVIDEAYGYQYGPVLFKPTLASGLQTFRTTRDGALAYFVGGDPAYPGDTGFALKGWRKVEVRNSAIFREGNTGTTQGNVLITDKDGRVTKVDKTWKFYKGVDGKLRIVLHHSSLPYTPPSELVPNVSEGEVLAAQKGWGDALVQIATTYDEQGHAAAKALAEQVLDNAYGYEQGPVLFKPTLASGEQTFRTTREGALAYFVGGNPSYPGDKGFALMGWRKVEVENAAIFCEGNSGTSMAKVTFTDKIGKVTMVDKTWNFNKGTDGQLRIVGHHSSLPYTPPSEATPSVSEDEVMAAQKGWGDALVKIGITYEEQGHTAAKALAEQVIDEAYGYQHGPVLFKPTLASGTQTFRTTREGALAYFVGGNPAYPGDQGFALRGWRKVEVENAAIFREGKSGTSVAKVTFTDKNEKVTTVEKTWNFYKGSDGKLRIVGHHSSLPYTPPVVSPSISEEEVLEAQRGWGEALVKIGLTYDEQGHAAAKALAEQVIDAAYGYQLGPVLFKPTLASGKQTFRTAREGALAYFVGGNPAYPGDKGFALMGWRKVVVENAAIFREGNSGTSLAKVSFTDKSGKVTVVDKTWNFVKAADGKLRIVGHHSSLPYSPASNDTPIITEAELLAAQKGWGDALVAISTTYEEKGHTAAKALAEQVIDAAYGYQYGPVLFKPTLASGEQTFRTTREGALAYFVGGNPAFPGDTGFALRGWRKVEVANAATFRNGSLGTTTGNVTFTDKSGAVTIVDKTWHFLKGTDGKLRIVGHHSSLPYTPAKVASLAPSAPQKVLVTVR